MAVRPGRPPIMAHRAGVHGRNPVREDESETPPKGKAARNRWDRPIKPDRFKANDKRSKELSEIWDKHIAKCPWLIEADTPKSVMWCYLWQRFYNDPYGAKLGLFHNLRTIGAELGFDPLSRTRMEREGLPVKKNSKYAHEGGKTAGKKADKERRKEYVKKHGDGRDRDFGEYQ